MFSIDEGADAALLLGFRHRVQGERRLARAFRPVDLDDAAARQAANAERDIEAERAGRHGFYLDDLLIGAKAHDRALAERAFDLRKGRIQGLSLVHRFVLYEPQ